MQEKVFNKLLEAYDEEEKTIDSYSQLIQALAGHELADIEALLKELQSFSFIEDEDLLYNKLPMSVFYKQLPVVVEAEVLVKVVILQQADGLVLVIPENVVETYQDLLENPDLLTEKNNSIELYAEVYNLNSKDEKLHKIIKEAYLYAGNGLKAFDLKDSLSKEKEDIDNGEEKADNEVDGFNFDEISEDLPEIEDIQLNEESYKKFKKQSNYLENLLSSLYEKANSVLKKNIKKTFLHKVLVIEVNNKNIYNQYEKVPAVAKKILSNFGEAIRKNKGTQLIDSFSKDGKRYFVVAENIANNYWYVLNEDVEKLEDDVTYIEPTTKTVIKLAKSSIRKESRAVVPYKKGRKTVFTSKTFK